MNTAVRTVMLAAALWTCGLAAAGAQTIVVPGPRIDIPSISPQAAVGIQARTDAVRFIRRDDDPPYVLFSGRAAPAGLPADLTAARGRQLIDEFAQLAPQMGCRTDDVADAYSYLIQSAMMAYNGSHFPTFVPRGGLLISCGSTSFGAVALSMTVHINLGTAPLARFSNRDKQRLYEVMVAFAGYLLENLSNPRPAVRANNRALAADTIKSLIGFRPERVRLTGDGVSIDDQYRP